MRRYLGRIALTLLILATVGGAGATTLSGAVHGYAPKAYDNIHYPALDAIPDEPTVADLVDERPLWRLLQTRQFVELRRELERYRHWYPAWQTPVDLVTGLTLGELSAGVKTRKDQRAWQELIALSEQHPEDFSCAKIQNRWAVAEAFYALGRGSALRSLYERILSECADPEQRLVTLQQATQRLPYGVTAGLLQREQQQTLSPAARTAVGDVEYRFYAAWLANAVQRNGAAEADRALAYLRTRVAERRDVGTASLLGWWCLRKQRTQQAIAWFTQALHWRRAQDLAYGLALAWKQAGRFDQVRILADNWHADPRIARLLQAPERSPIVLAYAQGHYQRSLQLASTALRRTGRHKLRQRRFLQNWRAWSLYKTGACAAAADQFTELYQASPNWQSAQGLLLSSQCRGDFNRPQALAEKRGGPLVVLLQPRGPAAGPAAALYYDYYRRKLGRQLDAQAYPAAREIIPRIAQRISARRDAKTAVLAAWACYNSTDRQGAEQWFAQALAWQPSAEAAYGLALARRAAANWAGTEQVAQRWGERYPVTRAVGRDALLDQGDTAYARKDFAGSLRLVAKARQYGSSRRGDLLAAWSRYGSGERQVATTEFARLYRAAPDDESARGWVSVALADQEDAALRAAATPDSPLQRQLRDHDADDYFGRDLFVLANATRVSTRPELAGVDSASIAVLPFARHRSGSTGLSRLDMSGVAAQARWGWGLHRFGLDVDWLNLDAGPVTAGAQSGSPGTPVFSPTTSATLVAAQVLYSYAGERGLYGSFGSTPLGGVIDGVPVGSLGLRSRTRQQSWELGLFAQNIQQSILSISGLTDPASGRGWGRVVERGGRGRFWHGFNDRWSLSGSGVVGQLSGHDVADNVHVGGHLGLAYALQLPGFDYFTVGPAYGFEHYGNNRRFFSYGHGGYFSPEQLHKAGLELNLQTLDGGQYVLRAYGALSWQHTGEASAYALPLTSSGPVLPGGTTTGVAFDANIAGVYRLGPHTQLGAFVDVVQSPNFTDVGGGLLLRFLFEPRPAVFNSDMPARPWRLP